MGSEPTTIVTTLLPDRTIIFCTFVKIA